MSFNLYNDLNIIQTQAKKRKNTHPQSLLWKTFDSEQNTKSGFASY